MQGMMNGWGGGWLMMLVFALLWILILVLLVLAIVWLWQRIRRDGTGRTPPGT